MRCVHEAQLHEANMFVTLTYDDKALPEGGTLIPSDLQLFHKRLHNQQLRARNKGIRYYACGEYGETNERPHYHTLIFSYSVNDLKYYKTTRAGFKLYTSAHLEKLWPAGMSMVGQVSFESAAYVARYVSKKITGEPAEQHYQGRHPEFGVMSRRPGIGLEWFNKYREQTYNDDTVVIRSQETRPPKYYDKKLEELDSAKLERLKRKRRRKAIKHLANNTPERRKVRHTVLKAKLNLRRRTL